MNYVEAYNPKEKFGELGAQVARRWPEKEIIKKKGKTTDTIGLALSGGGYRSAIYSYGVLQGLHELGVLTEFDYLSVVSGGSWIGMAYAMAESPDWFFHVLDDGPNYIEEGFESFLINPIRVLQEAALTRVNPNYASDLYGRLLSNTFLREQGDYSRFRPLSDASLVLDEHHDRPFLIVNGTAYFRRPGSFDVTHECFEMTRMYCGSRSLGYVDTASLLAAEKPIRIRDSIAVSGAAVSAHIPGLGGEVAGLGLSREIDNYARGRNGSQKTLPQTDRLDVADGGFYNNLGIESLINRGCGYIVVVDAEHDPESRSGNGQRQSFHGLRTLMTRHHIDTPFTKSTIKKLDTPNVAVHELKSPKATVPDILYIKLKSSTDFDVEAAKQPYNEAGLLRNLFSRGAFAFDPQFSTAKLDYDFAEHRNLSELGRFEVTRVKNRKTITQFVKRAK